MYQLEVAMEDTLDLFQLILIHSIVKCLKVHRSVDSNTR